MPAPCQPKHLCGKRVVFRSKTTAKGNVVKVKAQNRSYFTAIPYGVSRTRLTQKLRAIFFAVFSDVFRYANQNIQGNVLLSANIWKTSVFL